ncbi:MAG: Eco47II family restriction endonuclease [Patescibacteria group bacterium]
MSQRLPYITDEILIQEVRKVLTIANNAVENAEMNLHRSKVDPFSAAFDSLRQLIPVSEWFEQEKARQIQKTMQNAIGNFHQAILGNMTGWNDLGVGGVVDVKNDTRKIIAEIKNKSNTTKGNHKPSIYDDLNSLINGTYKGYTSYYVEVIPGSKKPYDKPFVPSDNKTSERRPSNEKIRVIDGRSFYALASGTPNALELLYKALPVIIVEAMGMPDRRQEPDPLFEELFRRVYP